MCKKLGARLSVNDPRTWTERDAYYSKCYSTMQALLLHVKFEGLQGRDTKYTVGLRWHHVTHFSPDDQQSKHFSKRWATSCFQSQTVSKDVLHGVTTLLRCILRTKAWFLLVEIGKVTGNKIKDIIQCLLVSLYTCVSVRHLQLWRSRAKTGSEWFVQICQDRH